MPNRTSAPLLSAVVLIVAVAAFMAADVRESSARKKKYVEGVRCECFCELGNNEMVLLNIKAVISCGGYNGRTCNAENSDGLVRTGKLNYCRGYLRDEENRPSQPTVGNEQQPKPPKASARPPVVKPGSRGTN